MSEQQSEPTSIETGSVSAAADAKIVPIVTESPAIAPDQELTSSNADASKVEPKVEEFRNEIGRNAGMSFPEGSLSARIVQLLLKLQIGT